MPAYPWHFRLVLAALCALLTLPFLNPHHFNPIPTFYQEWTAAACTLLAATLLLRADIFSRLSVPVFAFLPLGLGALTLLHLILARSPSTTQALIVLLYLCWAILLLVLGQALIAHIDLDRLATPCAIALLFGGLLSALLLACQLINPALALGWVFGYVKGGGNLAQANHLANYLWLSLVAALFLHARGTLGIALFSVCATLLVSAASLTGSRSIFLYGFAIFVLTLWAARRNPTLTLRRLSASAFALVLLSLVLQFLFSFFEVGGQLQTNVAGERMFREISGVSIRLQLWHTAWAMFTEHPWIGNGTGQFPYVSFLLAGEQPGVYVGGGEHAHNIAMQLLAEYGIAGIVLLIGTTLHWWLRFARADWTPARVWLAGSLLVIGVHSQLEYPLWHAYFLGIAALLIGAGSQGGWRPHLSNLSRLILCGILLLGTLALVTLGRDYRVLEHALNPGLQPNNERQSWSATVSTLSSLHRTSLFAHYVELVFAYQLTVNRDALADKITVCEHALRYSPADVIAYKYAFLLALAGRHHDAQQALHRALTSHPARRADAERQLAGLLPDYPELAPLRAQLPEQTKATTN